MHAAKFALSYLANIGCVRKACTGCGCRCLRTLARAAGNSSRYAMSTSMIALLMGSNAILGLSVVKANILRTLAPEHIAHDSVFSVSGRKYTFLMVGKYPMSVTKVLKYKVNKASPVVIQMLIPPSASKRQMISNLLKPPIPYLIESMKISSALTVNTSPVQIVVRAPTAI